MNLPSGQTGLSAMTFDDFYTPNTWAPFLAALSFHAFLLMWDPTILKASAYNMQAQIIDVKVMDHMPVMEPVQPKPAPVVKQHAMKKAKKRGLSMSARPHPVAPPVRPVPRRVAPKPFISRITIPKYVPTTDDGPIAASPMPQAAPAAARRVANASPIIKLKGKTRGVRASDVHFQLADRGSIGVDAGPVVAIPIGEERGETVALPSAPMIHDVPRGKKAPAGFAFAPGTGDLKNKEGLSGYHGMVTADATVEGALQGYTGKKVVAGHGFEIGGPVGDRKIMRRRLPEYPNWAEEKGISAVVKIYFTVRPDGSLRSAMRIVTSSGYTELDELAKQALLAWRFSPTSDDSPAEAAWGVITFRFTLA